MSPAHHSARSSTPRTSSRAAGLRPRDVSRLPGQVGRLASGSHNEVNAAHHRRGRRQALAGQPGVVAGRTVTGSWAGRGRDHGPAGSDVPGPPARRTRSVSGPASARGSATASVPVTATATGMATLAAETRNGTAMAAVNSVAARATPTRTRGCPAGARPNLSWLPGRGGWTRSASPGSARSRSRRSWVAGLTRATGRGFRPPAAIRSGHRSARRRGMPRRRPVPRPAWPRSRRPCTCAVGGLPAVRPAPGSRPGRTAPAAG